MSAAPEVEPGVAFSLVTARLRLRDYQLNDVEAVHRYGSDPPVWEHMPVGPNTPAETDAVVRRAIESAGVSPRRSYEVAVTDRLTGELIGGIRLGLQSERDRDASLGYVLRRDKWGQGLITEAARVLVDFGFTNLGLHRIWATVGTENTASRRVLEKLGMSREGTLREHVWAKGRWRDSYLYAVLERDRD